jgi:ankyrin repeat protein
MSDPLPAEPNQAEEEEEDHHPLPLRRLILECIHLAAHSGQVNIVQDLLSWVPSPELKGNALGVALSEGVKKWDPHVSAALLRHDGKPHAFGTQFLSGCLADACLGKRETLLRTAEPALLYSGIDYVNQSVLIGLLIKAGANPNVREFGQPLLHRTASVADCTGALKALLENCASPNERDSDHGHTALHTAVGTVKYCRGDPAVETVRYTWNETAVRLLLDHGSSATQGSFQGTTPLHTAARTSSTRLFNLVIESTTPPGQPIHPSTWGISNHHGETLLHHACLGGRVDIVELLLDQGLDVNQRSNLGWTPFLCALAPERRDWIERGGDWTLKRDKAVLDIMQLLTARGADTTAISDSGWTALHVLSLWGLGGHEQSILFPLALRLLQETPSLVDAPEPLPMPKDWNETDIGPNGESFFHWTEPRRNIDLLQWAIEKESRDVVNALREVGVDTAAKNADGKTAFEIAREHADIHRWGRPVLSEQ